MGNCHSTQYSSAEAHKPIYNSLDESRTHRQNHFVKEALDVIVIGAGFCGLQALWKLRNLGFRVRTYEAGNYLGGTWWWNRYPGARVDTEIPLYQLPEPKEVWNDFEWRERFPGREELMRYFRYLDKKLDLSKDIEYNSFVTHATWDEHRRLWHIKTTNGVHSSARHLIICAGFATKRYIPLIPGLENFKGTIYHSSRWPENGLLLENKKVSIIGTGSSGVQIIQEIGPIVEHLTVYQRTPNLAIPLRQVFNPPTQPNENPTWTFPDKSRYEDIFENITKTFASVVIDMDWSTIKFHEATPSERRQLYQFLWNYGGFAFWVCGYPELFFEQEANDAAYGFWAEKTRGRITNKRKRDLLAPLNAPHAWGTKRPALETNYYEVCDGDNVDVINLRQSPIIEVSEDGIRTAHEGLIEADVIILATGFDSVSGGVLQIHIDNGQGMTIQEKWNDGVKTYLGIFSRGFPNLYMIYGPQAPTAFANGPTAATFQGNWVVDLIKYMMTTARTKVENTQEAEEGWVEDVKKVWYSSLFATADSWYQGANIPGKVREPLNYIGGIPRYIEILKEQVQNEYNNLEFA